MEDSLGTAGNMGDMGDMADNMGMDLVLPMRFPLIPLLILLIAPPQTEHQRKRIVDLDEGFGFCIRTLGYTSFLTCILLSYANKYKSEWASVYLILKRFGQMNQRSPFP